MRIRKIMSLILACTLAVPAGSLLAVGETKEGLHKRVLFEASKSPEYGHYRIPGMVSLDDGTLLAYTEARKNSSDWADMDIVMKKSMDQGATWSEDIVLVDGTGDNDALVGSYPPGTMNNPVMIPDGEKVHMLYCVEYHEVYYTYSNDQGETWEKPVNITASCREDNPYPFKVIATGPGHGIKLSENSMNPGRLVVPIWMANGGSDTAHAPSVVSTIYSDDQGATWKVGEVVYATNEMPNPNETSAVELSDGRVMLNMRNTSGKKRRAITISDDGSSNWSAPKFDEALIDPICFGSTAKYDANTILFTNAESENGRKNITVKLSEDDAKTWVYEATIEPGGASYSDITVGTDKKVHVIYEAGYDLYLASLGIEDIKTEEPGKIKTLKLSEGNFNFYKDITHYTQTVPAQVKQMTITPTAYEGTTQITVNGKVVANGESVIVDVSKPRNTIEVVAESEAVTTTYTIEIKKEVVVEANTLVGQWKMNELVNGMILDETAHYNDFKMIAGSESATVVEGVKGSAIDFGNSYFDLVDPAGVAVGTGDFTVATWIKPESLTGQQFLFWYGTASSKQWWVRLNNNKLQFLVGRDGKEQLVETTLAGTEWAHIACQKVGDRIKLFVNGTEVASTVLSGEYDTNGTNRLRIGREISGAVRQYTGCMDDLRFYNYALDAASIKTVMEEEEEQIPEYAFKVSGEASIKGGTSFEVNVGVDNTQKPVYAGDVVINYDTESLAWIGATGVAETVIVKETTTPGAIRILWATPEGVNAAEEILILNFKALGTSEPKIIEIALTQGTWGVVGEEGVSETVGLEEIKQVVTIQKGEEPVENPEDINRDGQVDIADLALVAYYYQYQEGQTGWEEAKKADVNGDGHVDVTDLGRVANKILGIVTP